MTLDGELEAASLLAGKMAATKNHGIPIDHLDFNYVDKCNDVKELEKIYKVLVSGVEGKYIELENKVNKKIEQLAPNSRCLRKDLPIVNKSAISKSEQLLIDNEIEDFVKSIPNVEKKLMNGTTTSDHAGTTSNDSSCGAVDPPVRTAHQPLLINSTKPVATTAASTADKSTQQKQASDVKSNSAKRTTNKAAKPKDYSEWAKIEKDLEKNLEKSDDNDDDEDKDNNKNKKGKSSAVAGTPAPKNILNGGGVNANSVKSSTSKDTFSQLPKQSSTNIETLDPTVRERRADQEKCKGNEAFNAGSYEEAYAYYTRSIELLPCANTYNNRALASLRLAKWEEAVRDCNQVLASDSRNVKALFRRATALHKRRRFDEALVDVDQCLLVEPQNQKAKELKSTIDAEYAKDKEAKDKVRSVGGNRLRIDDTEGSSSSSSDEDNDDTTQKKSGQESSSSQHSKKVAQPSSSKKQIAIAEVESDDDDDEGNDGEKVADDDKVNLEKEKLTAAATPVASKTPPAPVPVPVQRHFDIPNEVAAFKNKANQLFTSGQYGEAIDQYSKAIETMQRTAMSKSADNDELRFFRHNMSVLHNNRATSAQSTGDYKASLRDCELGLTHLQLIASADAAAVSDEHRQTRLKLMWKKAVALEMTEKYADAFLQYEALMRLDSSFKSVQLNYNRVRGILKERGQLDTVRRSLPAKESDSTNPVTAAPLSPVAAATATAAAAAATTASPRVDDQATSPKVDTEKQYAELKTRGNDLIKLADYDQALECYTRCIELDASNPVAYLNRALCALKLREPRADLALRDATFVLERDARNVKALYRRALASRQVSRHEAAVSDLRALIAIEPQNQLAIRELQQVEQQIAKQSAELAKHTRPEQQRERVCVKPKIEEMKAQPHQSSAAPAKSEANKKVLISDITDNSSTSAAPLKHTTTSASESTVDAAKKKQAAATDFSPTTPTTATAAPMQVVSSAYEFLQSWNSINPKDIDGYARLLLRIRPVDLTKFIGSKLDDDMLTRLIKCIHRMSQMEEADIIQYSSSSNTSATATETTKSRCGTLVFDYLSAIAKAQRFNVLKLFIGAELKKLLSKLLPPIGSSNADNAAVTAVSRATLASLRSAFEL